MSRELKIILGMSMGAVIIFASAVGAYLAVRRLPEFIANQYGYNDESMSEDPARVEAAAALIARFDPPAGFEPKFMTDLYGTTIVAYERDGDSVIMLMQASDVWGSDPEALQQSMLEETGDELKVVEQHTVSILGEPAVLTLYETSGPGEIQRALYTTFKNRSGMVLLSIYAPVHAWNQAEIDTFIASIH